MARRRLLVLAQLLALAAAASLLLDASPVHIHTTATPPSSPAVPRPAAATIFRVARRLGPPHHRRLSELPSDPEPPAAASSSSDADAPAPAPAPAPGPAPAPDANDDDGGLALVVAMFLVPAVVLGFAVFSALLALLIVILRKPGELLASSVADLYAAAKAAREKATRVRPLGQDGVDAAGP
ncbi:hypothetical protein SETIT_1G063000v2 [Setaria italica]|uniref:Uncharacterized protein n=1 Tax=Setaria italica TaxID=4555 RepID=A0A368PID8_SETIT|nr:hypothetical protein SETIT_1G063000v2 [Setaria italica]